MYVHIYLYRYRYKYIIYNIDDRSIHFMTIYIHNHLRVYIRVCIHNPASRVCRNGGLLIVPGMWRVCQTEDRELLTESFD